MNALRLFQFLILPALVLASACEPVGGEGDACNNCEFEELSATPIQVASCARDALTVTCTWSDEESLARAPLNTLSAAMSPWRTMSERVPTIENDGAVVTYDLSDSEYQVGDPLGFRTTLSADWSGELVEIGETFQIIEDAELLAGASIESHYELWDIGLIADDKLAPELRFDGAMEMAQDEVEIRTIATIYRFVVDPEVGLDIYANGSLAVHADRAGYYHFVSETEAEYDPDPDTVD